MLPEFPCQIPELNLGCFGCCGRLYSEKEEVLLGIRKNTLTWKEELRQVDAATEVIVAELEAALKYRKASAQVFVGGSSVKGTGLRDNYDVDIFVRFKKGQEISDLLEEVVQSLPDAYERVHGSRDYFQLVRGKILFEIVPVRFIRSHKKAENVTDMSPLHVTYATKKLTKRMADDVRLAKQFCKAQRIYGAESYINGFSGHVLELLMMHYGSFQKLMKAVAAWNEQTVLDVEGHHKDPLAKLNASKLYSPLVIVDPVQPERNAAAALSKESYESFIVAAKKFTKKPSLVAFTIKPFTKETIKKKYKSGSLVILKLKGAEGKRDVVGAKCLKAFDYVKNHLEGLTIRNTGFVYNHEMLSALAFIHVKEKTLPTTYEQQGPPMSVQKDALRFMKKHEGKKVIERAGKLFVIQKRERRTLCTQVRALIKDSPVTSRVHPIL